MANTKYTCLAPVHSPACQSQSGGKLCAKQQKGKYVPRVMMSSLSKPSQWTKFSFTIGAITRNIWCGPQDRRKDFWHLGANRAMIISRGFTDGLLISCNCVEALLLYHGQWASSLMCLKWLSWPFIGVTVKKAWTLMHYTILLCSLRIQSPPPVKFFNVFFKLCKTTEWENCIWQRTRRSMQTFPRHEERSSQFQWPTIYWQEIDLRLGGYMKTCRMLTF